MRIIRVREVNAEAIIKAIKLAGYEAQVVDNALMPAPEVWCYRSYPGENWYEEQQNLAEMTKGQVPLQITCSGKKANKIINQLKADKII